MTGYDLGCFVLASDYQVFLDFEPFHGLKMFDIGFIH